MHGAKVKKVKTILSQLWGLWLLPRICTTSLTFNNSTFCPHSVIYVFCVDLRTNSDYFPIQYWLTGFYNWESECLLRGTDWVFIRYLYLRYFECWIRQHNNTELYGYLYTRNLIKLNLNDNVPCPTAPIHRAIILSSSSAYCKSINSVKVKLHKSNHSTTI
jgi:hypothetical protein